MNAPLHAATAGAFRPAPRIASIGAGLIGARKPDGSRIASDRDFATYLLDFDVAVVPGACFGLEPFVRNSYATSDAELATALSRIADACSRLSGPG